MARYCSPFAPLEVAVLIAVTPDGTPVLLFPLLALSLEEPDLSSSLFSCVPSTPPSTAPIIINAKTAKPIHSHFFRRLLSGRELYPRGDPALA